MKKNVYMYNGVTLLYKRNEHNVVNQLYFSEKERSNFHLRQPIRLTPILLTHLKKQGGFADAAPLWLDLKLLTL